MCGVCGCGEGETRIEGDGSEHDHHHHDHGHDHDHAHGLQFGAGTRLVEIETDILAKNQSYAERNRARLNELGTVGINFISSPGAGKTTLLVATIEALGQSVPVTVIEGDQESATDAERIRATGVPALQINTGRGCHLDAHMVAHALDGLPLSRGGILFIENVGNLVCPIGFDLGEAQRITILSVSEGDDKPLKYPDAFAAADLLLISKIDLLPHVAFDLDVCRERARALNPDLAILTLSARTGEGMPTWLDWVRAARKHALAAAERALADRLAAFRAMADAV